MNELQIFVNPQFGEIRAVEKASEPWFVAADVCKVLEHSNTAMALERLDDDEKYKFSLGLSGGDTWCVNEPGLYSLVLGSRKPEAKAFKRWITHEVIPSIRKTGGYIADQEAMSPEELMAKALMVAQKTLADREVRISALTVENQIMKPKAEYFDELVDRNLLTSFRETAKQLEIGPKTFVAELLKRKYIYRDKKGKLMPYQHHMDSGLFEVKECYNEKTQWSGTQTFVTPKGRETFRLLFISAA